jgi:hypothetical protein
MLWVGKVHLSEIISSVELYHFNIGGGLFSVIGHASNPPYPY